MPNRSRAGSLVIAAVLLTAVLGLGGVMVSRQLERDLSRQVRLASDGRELETLLEAAVEDAQYQLAIGAPPAADATAARAAVARALADKEGGVTGTAPVSSHDPAKFLRDATRLAVFAPVVAAGGMDPSTGIELAPVEVEVLDRTTGPWTGAPDADAPTAPNPELPTLFTALRTTWGLVEVRASARWPRPRGPAAVRRLTVRHLFTVVDHAFEKGPAHAYAHIFPTPVTHLLEAE